jgi:hypothetical protein
MRLAHLPLATLLVATPLAACSAHWSSGGDDGKPGVAASGSGGERHYAVANFDKIALAASGDVDVRTGQRFGVTVTGASADLDTLKVTQDGGTLGLGRKPGHWSSTGRIHWTVTMPTIREANIGGSGSIAIDRVEGGSFSGNIGGSGDLSVRGMNVDKASFAIGGSGNVDAAGAARALSLSVGGSGKLRARSLVAQTASISIAGAGDAEATVRRHADVSIVGSGDVTVVGGAQCSVTKMGAGNVRCG